jgi:hypothetical protein
MRVEVCLSAVRSNNVSSSRLNEQGDHVQTSQQLTIALLLLLLSH